MRRRKTALFALFSQPDEHGQTRRVDVLDVREIQDDVGVLVGGNQFRCETALGVDIELALERNH
jgi:hypothetical protein